MIPPPGKYEGETKRTEWGWFAWVETGADGKGFTVNTPYCNTRKEAQDTLAMMVHLLGWSIRWKKEGKKE